MSNTCVCGKGKGSLYDGICRYCREHLVSRAEAKKVNVRHRGDGMSVDQYRVVKGEVKRSEVYI
jgi:hypothetical protein